MSKRAIGITGGLTASGQVVRAGKSLVSLPFLDVSLPFSHIAGVVLGSQTLCERKECPMVNYNFIQSSGKFPKQRFF
jgi:hypothetical protein